MDLTWKKIALILALTIGPFIVALVLLSTPMMDTYYGWVKEDPKNEKSDWIDHRWLLMATADTCYNTMREEKAAVFYFEYLRLYPEDKENRPHVLLRYGHSLNQCNENRDALIVYSRFMEEYPERDQDCEAARMGMFNITHYKP